MLEGAHYKIDVGGSLNNRNMCQMFGLPSIAMQEEGNFAFDSMKRFRIYDVWMNLDCLCIANDKE